MLRLREMDVVEAGDVGRVNPALAEVEELHVTVVVEDAEQVRAEVDEAHDLMVCTGMSVSYTTCMQSSYSVHV